MTGRQAIVVSFAGGSPFSPRAHRTRVLAAALEQRFGFSVERVPGSDARVPRDRPSWVRRAARRAVRPVVIDYFEPGVVLLLSRWTPRGQGALLIGWPFSPLYHAAKRLRRAGIPYVVDVGDPWALTAASPPTSWRVGLRRARAAEAYLWRHAAGGVVTTAAQGAGLRALFPDLPLLHRPNGYREPSSGATGVSLARGDPDLELCLVHFGTMYAPRLPITDWLSQLRLAAGVRRVRLTNYGADLTGLHVEDPSVTYDVRPPVDWDEACRVAEGFDAALVVGNRDPSQLPSKAVEYLTLPIPRIALTRRRTGDELTRFALAKPGFIAVDVDSPGDALSAAAHARRRWSASELSPPTADSWREVEREIIEFLTGCWARSSARPPKPAPPGR